jgi:hypothetical protein
MLESQLIPFYSTTKNMERVPTKAVSAKAEHFNAVRSHGTQRVTEHAMWWGASGCTSNGVVSRHMKDCRLHAEVARS